MRIRVYHFSGVLCVVMGFLMIAIPLWLFPVCNEMLTLADGSKVHMPCYWLAKAEIAMGLCSIVCGVLFLKVVNKRMELGVAFVSIGILIVACLTPTLIVGGCEDELMTCYLATRPALTQVSLVALCGMIFGTVRLYNEIKRYEAGETAFVPLFQNAPPPRKPKPADEDEEYEENADEETLDAEEDGPEDEEDGEDKPEQK